MGKVKAVRRKERRFLGVSRSGSRGAVTMPLAVRLALRLNAGTRLFWYVSGDGCVAIKIGRSRLQKRGSRDNAR
ncbi:AbrB/MazE/SpoVT family DNA-binding domain-containing protein [Paraburkholderia fungorum]|jgi:bifunctional DNA-binding transcriptional regulator/antitoxin component of YhaV-PrlF toxin-antitoxin module|uniref:AbrB/MazE/SpoVT family DNA-binding domain-containing protein n=1 Tax=Paraburkholderia fungorum TaxID=134537 RepID=UPI003C6E329E